MKSRRSLWVLIGVGVVVLVVGGFLLWRRATVQGQPEAAQTAVVERGTLRVTVTASGNLEPAAEVALAFDVPGRVAEVLVDIGDEVQAGQPLVRLETADLERAVAQAELNLRQAELRLERLQEPVDEAEIRQAQHAVDQAAAALKVAQLNLTAVLSSTLLNEDLEDARYRLQDAEAQYARSLEEYKEGKIGDAMMDRVTQALIDARRYLERIEQQGQLQEQQARNELARAQQAYQEALDRLRQLQEGADPLDLEAARLEVEAAQLSLEKARSDLEGATLVAPFDGAVAAVNVAVGENVSVGVPAVRLVDNSHFRLSVTVDEIDVARLEVGLPAEITVDALPDLALTGTVERIGPAATLEEGAVAYPVVIGLDPTDAPLRAGMSATAVILVEELTDQLIIPNWVVRVDPTTGRPYVYRQTGDGGLERVEVRLGVRYEGYSQVLEGLEEGDVLVLVREETGGLFSSPRR
ncbi:MAG TPA: efflux RND transporter periplasmic adaptor subunit [Thermoflexia bacterium]|nr:efflux RND transporter periplasmic adaptor subunit [Thermoflexia bacterium]